MPWRTDRQSTPPSKNVTVLDRIRQAREQVKAVRVALQSSSQQEVADSLPVLARALVCVESLEQELLASELGGQRHSDGATENLTAQESHSQARSQAPRSETPPSGTPQPETPRPSRPSGNMDQSRRQIHHELASLKADLDAAQQLVSQGKEICETWSRMLGASTSGYTPTGDAAPVKAPARVVIKG